MSTLLLIKILAIILAIIVLTWFLINSKTAKEHLTTKSWYKTSFTGFIANFFDTFGIGSFANIVALHRIFRIMPDDVRLIGSMNIQAVLPTLAQALIFLHFIDVDLTTLIVSCVMISLGGFLSGFITVNIDKHLVRKIMFLAFIVTGIILLLSQLGVFHLNGTAHGLSGKRLILFSGFMFIAGFLPAFGVGYYSLVQIAIVMFSVNPIIAFPIMATACAFQMPITAIPFIIKKKFYSKSAIILMLCGVVGVIIAAPLIAHINSYYLKWILFIIIIYNVLILRKSFIAKHIT